MNILVFDPNESRLRITVGALGRRHTATLIFEPQQLLGSIQNCPVLILDESVDPNTVMNLRQTSPGICILIAMERKEMSKVKQWINGQRVQGVLRYPILLEEVEPFIGAVAMFLEENASQYVAVAKEQIVQNTMPEQAGLQQLQQPTQVSANAFQGGQQQTSHYAQPLFQQAQEQRPEQQTILRNEPVSELQSKRGKISKPLHLAQPRAVNEEPPRYPVSNPTMQEMVTITSSRGGVGKSTITYNLAALAAKNGVRTVVVDCDPMGNIALISGTEVGHTADSWIGIEEREASEMTIMKLLSRMSCGAFLLASGTQDTVNGISEVTMTKILAMLKRHFQLILVDCAPGFNEAQIVAYEQSNKILIVSPDDLTTFKHTIQLATDIRSLDVNPDKVHLVMNSVKKGKNVTQKLEDYTECTSIGSLPVTPDLEKAKDTGEAVVTSMPKLEFAKECNKILQRLIRVELSQSEAKRSHFLTLFGRKKKKAGDRA